MDDIQNALLQAAKAQNETLLALANIVTELFDTQQEVLNLLKDQVDFIKEQIDD